MAVLLQLSADGSKLQGMVYPTNTSRGPCSFYYADYANYSKKYGTVD